MKILIAEDDKDTALSYKRALEERGHEVFVANNGEECLVLYNEELKKATDESNPTDFVQPFDVVLLDYKMPQIDGIEVAKEIQALNQYQRVIFASAYVKETLLDSVKQLRQSVELLQKPFGRDILIYTIEKKEIYSELQDLVYLQIVDLLQVFRDLTQRNFIGELEDVELRHEQIRALLDFLGKKTKKESNGDTL
jgi:CheY-like chemotaxis protein